METSDVLTRTCLHCGAMGSGKSCSECGTSFETASTPRALLREDAAETIGLDRRLRSTLVDLLRHPVRIVSAYVRGDRSRYIPPFKLFFTLGGLYMIALSFVQPQRWDADSLQRVGVRTQDATRIESQIRQRGLTMELFNERFQSRMNAAAPIIVALSLLPMVLLLKLFDRRRSWTEHFMFMLGASNVIWLASLLVLPLARVSLPVYHIVLLVVMYAYLGILFCSLYKGRTTASTAVRFAIFGISDLALSAIMSIVLMIGVYASVLLF